MSRIRLAYRLRLKDLIPVYGFFEYEERIRRQEQINETNPQYAQKIDLSGARRCALISLNALELGASILLFVAGLEKLSNLLK